VIATGALGANAVGLSGRPYVRHLCRQTDIAYVALQLFTTVQSVFIQTGLKILQKILTKACK